MLLIAVLGAVALFFSTDFARKLLPMESLPAVLIVAVALVAMMQTGHLG